VSAAPQAPRRAALAFIFVTVALDMLAFGVVIPVLPRLILEFRGGDTESAAWWQALFGSVFAALQFACAPALGALSDRFGRRPVILLSSLALALDYVLIALAMGVAGFALYAWAPSTPWIFVAIAVGAFWSVWGAAAQSLLTQQVEASQQGRLQGALAALRSGCQMLTPILFNGVFALAVRRPEWGLPGAPFWLSALLVAIALPLAVRVTRAGVRHS